MNHDLVAAQAAGEIVALLTLCQQQQSEKDGWMKILTPAGSQRLNLLVIQKSPMQLTLISTLTA
ncbi:hypothetical protein [Erwinia mallotivora]|uniref:hypothetical protein n=1 Tax=Erwinia mallotivora TaxID=69222 RepID=UPI0021C03F67|nr:hypothetical protein [Erwinia mallotivora]